MMKPVPTLIMAWRSQKLETPKHQIHPSPEKKGLHFLGSLTALRVRGSCVGGTSRIKATNLYHRQVVILGKSFHLGFSFLFWQASLVAQRLKRLPGMQETWVRFLNWEDPLEKEMATHSSTLAWRIPWREEPGRLQSMGLQRVRHDW